MQYNRPPMSSKGKKLPVAAVHGNDHSRHPFTIRTRGIDFAPEIVRETFRLATAAWEGIVIGYPPDVNLDGLTIHVSLEPIDGPGGVFATACPTVVRKRCGLFYACEASLRVDTDDIDPLIANGWFLDMLIHEIAHAIGFGSLWTRNHLYVPGSGRYTGQHALKAYRSEFGQPHAEFVPVETGGSRGTRDRHWDEIDGGCVDTGIASTVHGSDIRYELMTGWFNGPDLFISHTTRQQFVDLGYVVIDPEPAPYAQRAEPDT